MKEQSTEKRLLSIIAILTLIVIGLGAVLLVLQKHPSQAADTEPPTFSGLSDITVYTGEGISYRSGVSAWDNTDGKVSFTVDSTAVDLSTPGTYIVVYSAADSANNIAKHEIYVTVMARPANLDEIHALIDPVITENNLESADIKTVCEFLYYHIKGRLSYTSESDKTDVIAEARRGLVEGNGDCFTYYAVAKVFFDRLGISSMTVQRKEGVLPSTHYWLLVNTGSEEARAWYHWDCCPHYKEFPLYSCLITDEELLAYHEKVPNYYTFDMEQYPRTPD